VIIRLQKTIEMYQETTTLFDSASANQKYNNGSQFDVNLVQYPLSFPNEAKNKSIYVNSARVWWTVPNLPDTYFKFQVSSVEYISPIAKGLYDLTLLSQAISNSIRAFPLLNPAMFTFTADLATQKVDLTFALAGTRVDFRDSPIGLMMGFESNLYPQVGDSTAGQVIKGENPADFNKISSFLIKMSGLRKGIPVNNSNSGILCEVLINSSPGSQINFEPINPILIPVGSEFENGGMNNITFTLTDNNGRAVDTNNESWSFKLTQRWTV